MCRSFPNTMLVLLGSLLFTPPLGGMEGRLFMYPDIHGDAIVFTYENDLWIADGEEEPARRLTSHTGWEGRAKFSPDGSQIAFTANYDGGWDMYVMPAVGGEPRRLTWHPAGNFLIDWSRDGRRLLFRSRRRDATGSYSQLYSVSVEGGYPRQLPVDRVRYACESPDGTQLVFNRFASDAMNWKGYRGGRQQDLWVTDLSGKNFERITHWEGFDNHPMWHERGIYFTSDREDGRLSLYWYDPAGRSISRKTRETVWDVQYPSMGGDRIVYVKSGRLHVFDITGESSRRLEITVPSDRAWMRPSYIDPTDYIESVTLTAGGDTAVVEARGDIYLLDREDDRVVNLTETPGSREIHLAPSPDGRWIAFFSDRTGEYELYITEPRPGSEWIPLTRNSSTYYYELEWSPDSEKILFGDKDLRIFFVDIEDREPILVDRSIYQKDNEIFWRYRDYTWSPDSKWVAYSLVDENLNSSLFLYEIESGEHTRLTDWTYDDYSPAFDPSGKHLFFLSRRNFEPLLDPFMDNNVNVNTAGIYLFQLQAGRKPPFEDGWEAGEEDGGAEGEVPALELVGIGGRLFRVPVPFGTYSDLRAGGQSIFYLARDDWGFPSLEEFLRPGSVTTYRLMCYDPAGEEETTVIGGIGRYVLSPDGGMASYRIGDIFGVVDTGTESGAGEGMIILSPVSQRVDVLEEYRQMFLESWRLLRDFFYDPAMHGKDWEAIREKYEDLIPSVGNKDDLNWILGEMTGELTASHEYIFGGPEGSSFDRVRVGLLGADLVPDEEADAYRFEHIFEGVPWEDGLEAPLDREDIHIEEGYYLFAVDGERIHAGENYLSRLVDKAGQEVRILVGERPDVSKATEYTVRTIADDGELRYREWIEGNRRTVEERSGGHICYLHLTDMDEEGIAQFERDFRAYRHCGGLVIDVRENGGGFVSWFIIDKLERVLLYFTRTRDFVPMRYPHGVHQGPKVVICNGGTGSDGEIFTQHFKDLGLGTVIGTPTWGGLIGIINMIPLVDGTLITQPNVGFFNAASQWIIENEGARPDVLVENDPASVLAGRDPQLERAIELIMEKLESEPPVSVGHPAYPVK